MPLILTISICTPNLVQIRQELAEICPFVYFPRKLLQPSCISKMCYIGPLCPLYRLFLSAHQIWRKSFKNWWRYACLCAFWDGSRHHLRFFICHFGPPTMSPLMGTLFSANGVMISLNLTKILQFYHFAIWAGKFLFPPILGV